MVQQAERVWTVHDVLRWATDDFRSRGVDGPRLCAELLLGRAIGSTRIQLIVDAARPLSADELGRVRELVRRRRGREPIDYILGEREFYRRTFRVDRRVLVPRPDTETLVDVALERSRAVSMSMRALDLCTGSGCVAITLARERPTASVLGTDASADALAVALDNKLRLGAYNLALLPGDLFAAVPPGCVFDVITANPPYIPSAQLASLQPEVRDFEPRGALDGGQDGLDLVRRVVEGAGARLAPGGVLAVEVAAGQAASAVELLARAGYAGIEVRRDYGRVERVVSGVLHPR